MVTGVQTCALPISVKDILRPVAVFDSPDLVTLPVGHFYFLNGLYAEGTKAFVDQVDMFL